MSPYLPLSLSLSLTHTHTHTHITMHDIEPLWLHVLDYLILRFFEIRGTRHPQTQHHISEEINLCQHGYVALTSNLATHNPTANNATQLVFINCSST